MPHRALPQPPLPPILHHHLLDRLCRVALHRGVRVCCPRPGCDVCFCGGGGRGGSGPNSRVTQPHRLGCDWVACGIEWDGGPCYIDDQNK